MGLQSERRSYVFRNDFRLYRGSNHGTVLILPQVHLAPSWITTSVFYWPKPKWQSHHHVILVECVESVVQCRGIVLPVEGSVVTICIGWLLGGSDLDVTAWPSAVHRLPGSWPVVSNDAEIPVLV